MVKKQRHPKHKQPVSPTTVWLAVIASALVSIVLYIGLLWLDNQAPNATVSEVPSAQSELGRNELIIIGLIVGLLVFGPGILVALIVLPIIRKNKKK